MDSQQLIESLSKMEQSLQGVESAREQVQQVADAYGKTKIQLTGLISSINQMSLDMQSLIKAIKDNQDMLSESYGKRILTSFDSIDERTKVLIKAAKMMEVQFSAACTSATTNFLSETDASIVKLQQQFDETIKHWNEQASAEINDISMKIETFLAETNNMKNDFKNGLTRASQNHKKAEDMIIDNFNTSINKYVTEFDDIRNEMQKVLDAYKTEIDLFWKRMSENLAPLATSINELKEQTTALQKDGINQMQKNLNSVKSEMVMQLEILQKQVKTNRTILIVTFLAVIVTILIRFM
jgi:ElaB/YqjD/DUF883 family membrane-anchored ribosome-binding protein